MDLTEDELIDMLYAAAESTDVPDIGNRDDLRQTLFGDDEAEKIVAFFNQFGKFYARRLVAQ